MFYSTKNYITKTQLKFSYYIQFLAAVTNLFFRINFTKCIVKIFHIKIIYNLFDNFYYIIYKIFLYFKNSYR